jgi:CRP/FNR family transcriptional regulator, cyclic AMP receptor protein
MADVEPGEYLDRLDPPDRAALLDRGRRRRWPAGASLFLEGDQSGTVVFVVSGRVKVFSLTEHGEEILLAVRHVGRA